MQLLTVKIDKPDDTNFILGQTHFIKSVEDIHEALVAAVPGIKFGLAFCEASGKCLVRWSGTDPAMTELAKKNAVALEAGHSFIVFLGDGFFPLNVLNALNVNTVDNIYGVNPALPRATFLAATTAYAPRQYQFDCRITKAELTVPLQALPIPCNDCAAPRASSASRRISSARCCWCKAADQSPVASLTRASFCSSPASSVWS